MTASNGSNLTVQGRLVWGIGSDLFKGRQKTDFNTKVPLTNAAGEPKIEYGFGIAVLKMDPATGQATAEYSKLWAALQAESLTLFPSGQIPPGFANKLKDGDSVDPTGKSYSEKEGYGGHVVLACTTMIPIRYFKWENGQNVMINSGIKVGDYVNMQVNVKAHPAQGQGKAGLYINPSAVQLIQPGKEIVGSVSGDEMFGLAAPAFAGQMVADVAPTMPVVGQAPMGQPQMPAAAMPMGQPAMPAVGQPQMPAAAPVQAPAHHAVLPVTHQPAPMTQTEAIMQPTPPAVQAPVAMPGPPM